MTTNYLRRRNNMRLAHYDYSQYGCYFVTICTKNKQHIFGEIINGKVSLNEIGIFIDISLNKLLDLYPNSRIPKYVIMPNHLHFIWFNQDNANLSDVVRMFKGITTKYYRDKMNKEIKIYQLLWQRSFYEHIIRNEEDFIRIWEYIDNNPLQWHLDRFYK